MSEEKRPQLHHEYLPESRSRASHGIPFDGSMLLIDGELGIVMSAELASIVPSPPREVRELLRTDDDARAEYDEAHGLPLLMPGSPGTPIDQFRDWDEDGPWIIDTNNGAAVLQTADVVIVPMPDEDLYYELESDEDAAMEYAAKYGRVPTAPFNIQNAWWQIPAEWDQPTMRDVNAASDTTWSPPTRCSNCASTPTWICTLGPNSNAPGRLLVYCDVCRQENESGLAVMVPVSLLAENSHYPQWLFRQLYKIRATRSDPMETAWSFGFEAFDTQGQTGR